MAWEAEICEGAKELKNLLNGRRLDRTKYCIVQEKCDSLFSIFEREGCFFNDRLPYIQNLQLMFYRFKLLYDEASRSAIESNQERIRRIEKLDEVTERWNSTSLFCSLGRFTSSLVELSGAFLAMLIEDNWVKKVTNITKNIGLSELAFSYIESNYSKHSVKKADALYEENRITVMPLVEFLKSEEVENFVNSIFPRGVHMDVVLKIQEFQDPTRMKKDIFMSIVTSNTLNNFLLSFDLVRDIYWFSKSNLAWLWWNKVSRKQCTFAGDSSLSEISSCLSEVNSLVRYYVPRIPNLAFDSKRCLTLTMYDSWKNLRHSSNSPISAYLKRLKEGMIAENSDLDETLRLFSEREYAIWGLTAICSPIVAIHNRRHGVGDKHYFLKAIPSQSVLLARPRTGCRKGFSDALRFRVEKGADQSKERILFDSVTIRITKAINSF